MLRTSTLLALIMVLCFGSGLNAQDLQRLAIENLQTKFTELGLSQEDVVELRVKDHYPSPSGVEHVYVQQYLNGVPVFNGQASLHFKQGQLVHRTSSLYHGLATQPVSIPAISAYEALLIAARPMDVTTTGRPVQTAEQDGQLTFTWSEISNEPITAQLMMVPVKDELFVSWQFVISQINTPDIWVAQVDAVRGQLIARHNRTLYCSFNSRSHSHKEGHHQSCFDNGKTELNENLPFHEAVIEAATVAADGATYKVFPFGIEAPIYGDQEIVVDPADPLASPLGWHDTNNQEGPEYTTTRGNNVWAYLDRDGNDSADTDVIADGGDSLVFDFFYEDFADPDTLARSALTQVFYMTNAFHDFTHAHGFDEASGNFQQNNYGNGGQGNDPVRAEAQDGSGQNNANFGTPPDGGSGRMQMFLWNNNSGNYIILEDGREIDAGAAVFGPQERPEAFTGELAVAVDATNSPELVCEAVANTGDVNGKIALIRRGDCFFEEKVLNAEAAGAIAVIICNPANDVFNMGGGVDNDEPTIHSMLIPERECVELRTAVLAGETVNVTFPAIVNLPDIDGDFDNGIVAHEIGHGVSNRLVGGPSNAGCLSNDEQMGEGWSDFFSLASSPINNADEMPDGTESRGIGNFAIGRGPDGGGIRGQPYSTDMGVNSRVYDAVIVTNGPHPLGETWAATLWDLYWAMVDDYGFDEDLINGSGGNNIAVELVIEGMKFTSCNPGLVSGRDGILAADEITNDGANICRIWEVFARRGIGFSAEEGSTNDRTDNVEAFDIDPACIPTVKVSKTSDLRSIDAGEEVQFTIRVRNDKSTTATDIVVTDELPEGMELVPGSVNGVESFIPGTNTIIFNVGDIDPEENEVFNYRVITSPDLHSSSSFFDGAEEDDENWIIEPLNGEGTFIWEQVDEDVFDGDLAWFVENVEEANDQVLQIDEPFELIGASPAIRFFTKYDTEPGRDGGIVEMSTDGSDWTNVPASRFYRGYYRGEILTNTFSSLMDLNSYWGDSDGYRDVYLDFSDMAGETIFLRWRFGSNGTVGADGWWVDNIEVIDLFRYQTTTTLSSSTDDEAATVLPDGGVMVEPEIGTDVVDPELGLTSVKVFPNPAGDFLKVAISSELGGNTTVQLISIDGRLIEQQSIDLLGGAQTLEFNTAALPSGVYLVQVLGAQRVHTEKVSIR